MSDNTDYRETCHGPGYRMIVVVEGISAAGKTTWCHKHAAEVTIPEAGPCDGAPDPVLDPRGAARFWVEQGARRWTAACEMERSRGIAVCDTDPLKCITLGRCGRSALRPNGTGWKSVPRRVKRSLVRGLDLGMSIL